MQLLSKEQVKKKEVEKNNKKQEDRIKINTEITNEIKNLNAIKHTSKIEKDKMLNNLADFSDKVRKKVTELQKEVDKLEERKRLALAPISEEFARLAEEKNSLVSLADDIAKKQEQLDISYREQSKIYIEAIKEKGEISKEKAILDDVREKARNENQNISEKYKILNEKEEKFEKQRLEIENELRKRLDKARYEEEKNENDKKLLLNKELELKILQTKINSERNALNAAIAEYKRKGIKL